MDQSKIGQFIQGSRKRAGLTQKELAQQLGVSDKLISKWETGNGMPDITLLDSLCRTLHISVNELLSGEVLTPENYSEKAEENIMTLLKDNETNQKSAIISIVTGIVFILLGILYLSLTTNGASPMLVPCYVDFPTLLILIVLEFACILIMGARTPANILAAIKKTILPLGALAMVFEMIGLFNSISSPDTLFPSLAISVIPLLYALGIYVFALLAGSRVTQSE